MPAEVPEKTLFERLGGRPAIAQHLRRFYADVRQHREIGPIFNARVSNWPEHIELITDFWSGATGGPVAYRGQMPMQHLSLGLEAKHFEAWLELWRRHCRIEFPPREAEELITRAETIGARLHQLVGR